MQPPERPAAAEIQAALGRVLASPGLASSPRLTAFLRYIVERALAGEGSRIKGYTIATEALGRDPSFDPVNDPIVRVEAGRLRRALERYYAEGGGADDPLRIELPRGNYVPTFRLRAEPPASGLRDGDATDLDAALRQLVGLCRLQLRIMTAEVEMAERILQRSREPGAAPACRPRPRLLPTAPSSRDAARPADGRQIRQVEQAQGAPAARVRRSRPGRDRGDAAHDRGDPRGL